ncbi:hypothetical protein AVEN_162432-1 [Araneus ventricosus]|uniref:Uncharacterized protein n=1 Tax=Araneus ventricosus TaxID=182803 RepID=A0A4Y2NN25_ARAVE|nr:hypothetical protein AVEN_162432-1 [Araneus ventricosus]
MDEVIKPRLQDLKVAGSKLEFTKDPCIRTRCELNLMPEIKHPRISVAWNLVREHWLKHHRRHPITVHNYDVHIKITLVLLRDEMFIYSKLN